MNQSANPLIDLNAFFLFDPPQSHAQSLSYGDYINIALLFLTFFGLIIVVWELRWGYTSHRESQIASTMVAHLESMETLLARIESNPTTDPARLKRIKHETTFLRAALHRQLLWEQAQTLHMPWRDWLKHISNGDLYRETCWRIIQSHYTPLLIELIDDESIEHPSQETRVLCNSILNYRWLFIKYMSTNDSMMPFEVTPAMTEFITRNYASEIESLTTSCRNRNLRGIQSGLKFFVELPIETFLSNSQAPVATLTVAPTVLVYLSTSIVS